MTKVLKTLLLLLTCFSLCLPSLASASVIYDVDGDGCFKISDLLHILSNGLFETRQPATFSQGDFDNNGTFGTSDLILALISGTFGQCHTNDNEPPADDGGHDHDTPPQDSDDHGDHHSDPDDSDSDDSDDRDGHGGHDHHHRAWGLPSHAYASGSSGTAQKLVQRAPSSAVPRNNALEGAFRSTCHFSHMAFNDPIVKPNQPGGSHLHSFFGNTAVDAYTTEHSLLNTGNSTCNGGILNRSSYWVPTMLDANDWPIRPSSLMVYYKTTGNAAEIKKIPNGLRIVSGDMSATKPQSTEKVNYTCKGRWTGNHARIGDTNCRVGEQLLMRIYFPVCWNGDLDSPDHKSHMTELRNGKCPSSHPIHLPRLSLQVAYDVTSSNYKQWRLSSDMYDVKNGNGGLSSHADYFAAWDENISETWAKHCINKKRDCHGQLLGDGRMLPPAPRTVDSSRTRIASQQLEQKVETSQAPFAEAVEQVQPKRRAIKRQIRKAIRATKKKQTRSVLKNMKRLVKKDLKNVSEVSIADFLNLLHPLSELNQVKEKNKKVQRLTRRATRSYVELVLLVNIATS